MRMHWAKTLLAAGVLWTGVQANADDWPRWRGPDANGISKERGWFKAGDAPVVAWKASVGKGYSAVSVVADRLLTMGNEDGRDSVRCLDATTGGELWTHSYPCGSGSYPGPRAMPVVDGRCVYTVSREGLLLCLGLEKGAVLWQLDLRKEAGAKPPQWGFAGSPLVLDELVVVNVCAWGVAVDKAKGTIAWKSPAQPAGYATPVLYKGAAGPALAVFGAKGLVGVDLTGAKRWEYPWETSYDVNAADPIVDGTRVFITSGYGRGANLLDFGKLAEGRPAPVYAKDSKDLAAHFSTPVLWKGCLFAMDGNAGRGQARCLDFATGEVKWTEKSVGFGSLMMADGKLIILNERGELIVADASPEAYRELARGLVLGPTCWTMPVLANGRVYCRNEKGDLVCVRFAPKPAAP